MDLLSNSIEKGMSTDINSSSVMETGVKSLLKTAHQCIRARRATAERAELGRGRERGGHGKADEVPTPKRGGIF